MVNLARYCSLFSGSTGNCYYIGSSGRGLIIDAGVSCRSTVSAMMSNKINLSAIDGILITHEHLDHIKGLGPLIKHFKCPVYGTKATLDYLSKNDYIPVGSKMEVIDRTAEIGAFQVKAFITPHDCNCSVGYKFTTSDNTVITHVTDLGYISNTVSSNLKGSHMVIIESNYDPSMLESSGYPASLKQRIMGKEGHLSNIQCAEEVLKLVKSGTSRIMLAHLSRENNRPSLARQTTTDLLKKHGFQEGKDYALYVASANSPSEMIII